MATTHQDTSAFNNVPKTDHIYLSPKFYAQSLSKNNHHNLKKTRLIEGACDYGKTNSQAQNENRFGTTSSPLFNVKTEQADSSEEALTYFDGDESLNGSVRSIPVSGAEDESYDEDSNDTRSCSSSSGCSSSSNSMVGSVNRHLSHFNSGVASTSNCITISSTGNHFVHQNSNGAGTGTITVSGHHSHMPSSSHYKDITPKQVSPRCPASFWCLATIA